jgi:hypothetical protein
LPGLLEGRAISEEGLAEWMQAHQQAMEAAEEQRSAHETILGVLSALATWDISVGQALRLPTLQARRLADEPAHAALYCQAAAAL